MAYEFEIFKESEREDRFRLLSGSGEVIVTSGQYPSRAEAKQGIKVVLRAGMDSGITDQTDEE